jgi:hypothetical protein
MPLSWTRPCRAQRGKRRKREGGWPWESPAATFLAVAWATRGRSGGGEEGGGVGAGGWAFTRATPRRATRARGVSLDRIDLKERRASLSVKLLSLARDITAWEQCHSNNKQGNFIALPMEKKVVC